MPDVKQGGWFPVVPPEALGLCKEAQTRTHAHVRARMGRKQIVEITMENKTALFLLCRERRRVLE